MNRLAYANMGKDNMGLNETDGRACHFSHDFAVFPQLIYPAENTDASKSPRGIRGFELPENELFRQWKVQGKVGGYTQYVL